MQNLSLAYEITTQTIKRTKTNTCFREFHPIEPEINETLTEEQQREAVMRFATGSR